MFEWQSGRANNANGENRHAVHLANVADDVEIETTKDQDAKRYELSIVNSEARVSLVVARKFI